METPPNDRSDSKIKNFQQILIYLLTELIIYTFLNTQIKLKINLLFLNYFKIIRMKTR